MTDILTSIHGNRIGLSVNDDLVMRRQNGDEVIAIPSVSNGYKGVATVTIPSAQLLALNATPRTIVPAQGAGLAVIPTRLALRTPGGTAYAGIATGEDLVLKYTNGSGAQCSGVVETTGFLDQATAQLRVVGNPGSTGSAAGDFTPVANAPVVLHLLAGEITTGDFPLIVRCWYDVIPTDFA